MADSAERVASFLKIVDFEVDIRQFEVSTRNSVLAAHALGCSVAEIAKSVVFSGAGTYVAIVSGDRRVDSMRLSKLVGDAVELASPDVVRERTGYPIGGVPPFPHNEGVRVLPDLSLTRFHWVWAAGGVPNIVFRVRTIDLLRTVHAGPFELSMQ